MYKLYENISLLREKAGIKNDTELCRKACVPRSVMTELKSGRTQQLSRITAEKFCQVLNVSIDELYGIKKEKPATVSGDELTEIQRKAIDLIKSIEDEAVLEIFIAAMEKAIKK